MIQIPAILGEIASSGGSLYGKGPPSIAVLHMGAAGGPKRSLAALAALPSLAFSSSNWHCETSTQFLLQGYVRAATMS